MKCPNCGNDLVPGALFCASCGSNVQGNETPPVSVFTPQPVKIKKNHTRMIGIIAVAVVAVIAVAAGFGVWQVLHPDMEKQLVYCKEGVLYYTGNMDKDKEPIEVYDSQEKGSNFDAELSEDQKYLFFRNNRDQKAVLYRAELQKFSGNASKYIEEIDTHVGEFETFDSGKVLYYKDTEDTGNDLFYYDGKENRNIDSNVKKQYRSGNNVYYLKNDALCYYNMSNKKQEEIGDCDQVFDYNEDNILYGEYVEADETDPDEFYYDVYMAKPGDKSRKIATGVNNVDGDLDSGNIYYAKPRGENHSYYDYVNDPYADQDKQYLQEQDPNLETVDPEDILYDDEYIYYMEYGNSDFCDEFCDYDEEIGMYTYYYFYAGEGMSYIIDDETGKWYVCDDSEPYEYFRNRYEAGERESLRENLRSDTYSSKSYDLFLYHSKGGEKKIAESVVPRSVDAENEICLYNMAEEKAVEKVCSIDDLEDASDVYEYMDSDDSKNSTIYVSIGISTQKQKLDIKSDSQSISIQCSEDGNTVMLRDQGKDDDMLVAYKKKSGQLEKIGTVEKHYRRGYWSGNDYYYYNLDNDFYVYSGGKEKKIAEHVDDHVYQQDDGYYTAFEYGENDLKLINEKGEEEDILRNVNYGFAYLNRNRIVYIKDGDLYLYDGEGSRKIERDVRTAWCRNALRGIS